MAVYTLASQKNITKAKGTTMSSLPSSNKRDNTFVEGLGYLGEKTAVGFVSSVEGIWDYAASGIAKLFNADAWAEEQIANDWFGDWYSHPDEWFNATGGWKIAGDVASGIGTSLPAMAAALGITVATGGAGAPLAAGIVAGLGAAGRNVKEAYEQTGKLGGKEYLYGGLTGAVEGGIEALTDAVGLGGVGSIFKNFGKSATKSIASRIGVAVVDGFVGEAFEEGFSEFITPYIKRLTYDPNAKAATAQEIGYAALVGGLSGAIMGGAGATVDVATSIANGTKTLNNGNAEGVMNFADAIYQFESEQSTKSEQYERIASSYAALKESLAKTNGKIETANQRMMLGDLSKANVESVMSALMSREAAFMLENVDTYVDAFNKHNYTDANGKVMQITAEQLTAGFDGDIMAALKSNDTLRTLSAMSVAGRLMADTSMMADSVLRGENFARQTDINYFAEKASESEIEGVSRALGITDWTAEDRNSIGAKLEAYRESGALDEYLSRAKVVDKIKKVENKRSLPQGIVGLNKDGAIARYSDGVLDIGVARVGDNYLMYDFNNGDMSRLLTKGEVDTYLKEYSQEKYTAEETKRKEAAEKRKAEAEELDTWARENVSDYAALSAQNKSMIRKVIRNARSHGLAEADVKMWADMSAHSGLDIQFKKMREGINAYYDDTKNRIVVNPDAKISQEKALFHELDHAIRTFFAGKGEKTVIYYKEALEAVDEDTKAAIKKKYGEDADIFNDETNAFYAAEVMSVKGYAKALATIKPSIKQRILSFFKDASSYKNEGLSSAAKKYYKEYQKLYASFSARNKGANAYEGKGEGTKRYSIVLPFVDNNGIKYDNAVLLDSHDFDNISPRDWWKVLKKHVDDRSDRSPLIMPIFDELGKIQFLQFAKKTDRISKNGGSKHQALTELYATSDNISKLSVIHIDEIIELSEENNPYYTNNNEHGKFDKNGWLHRNAYVINAKNGNIYNITIDIAKTDDGRTVLYATKGKIKKVGQAKVNSLKIRGSTPHSNSNVIIPQSANKSTPSAKKDAKYFYAIKHGDTETAQKMVDEAAKEAGYARKMFHETDADNIHVFDISRGTHGGTDSETPYGIFTKSSDKNIGLGSRQMSLYVKAKETLYVKNREDVKNKIPALVPYYDEISKIDKTYDAIISKLEDAEFDALGEWMDEHPDVDMDVVFPTSYIIEGRAADIDSPKYHDAHNEYIRVRKEWENKYNEIAIKSKDLITRYLRDHGYDSMYFEVDGGSRGRQTDSLILLDPEQVKSAELITYDDNGNIIPLSERFNTENKDIRYSLDLGIETFPNGTRVRANDRGNVGVIVGYDKTTDSYSVRFTSKEGLTSTLQMTESQFVPISKKAKKKVRVETTKKSGEPLTVEELQEQIETKAMTEMPEKYKPKVKDKAFSGITSLQISLTNEQAGIEKIGKKLGIKGIEAKVQAARAARNMAEDMLGNEQYRIGASGKDVVYQGEGLGKIFSHIKDEDEELFNTYLLHWHNTSRMSLEERSQAKIDAAKTEYETKVSEFEKANRKLQKLVKQKEKAEPYSEEAKAINKKLKTARAETIAARKAVNESKKAYEAMSLEENKPVFAKADGSFVTAEESRKIIAEIEKEHSDFKGIAEKIWAFNKNLNQYRVDTGLITQEDFDYLNEKYPYYVPTYRDGGAKGIVPIQGSHDLKVKQTVKTATGSGKDILPIKTIMARQVMETVRAGQINKLAKALYDASGDGNDYIAVVSRQKRDDLEVNPTDERPKNNQITFYDNGEKVTLAVSREIFLGFDGFHGGVIADSALLSAMNKVNKGFKSLVTSYSPAFMIRNPIRDLQDAGLYTKYGAKFAKNYARVGALIKNNSKEWQLFRAMGGLSSSLFNMDEGVVNSQNKWGLTQKEGNILQKGLDKIEQANVFLEQLPRFAEFLSAIESGVSYEQAILDAADITTNFGRTGKITKILNATIVPFLNPSIQGFSKMIRTVTSVKTAREAGALALKAAMLGIAPMVINKLMYEDDEDYKQLRENDKENNFLFKIGDTFIKLPRGRVVSILGGLYNRSEKSLKGEDADWKGYAENILQQVTPVDSMSRTIFSPLIRDLPTNTTWYGTAIEGRELENKAPRDRYDESTSSIAVGIGKVLNYSPKKIHYLLDQYTGVIGDIILPLTSKKAEKDFFTGNFTIDPATSNKLSSDFYKLYDETNHAKSAGDSTAKYQLKYLNKVKKSISTLYDEKSAIQNSDLKAAEKLQQTRAIQVMINQIYKTALADFGAYTEAFEATAYIDDSTDAGEKMRYTEATRMTQGAEAALESYNEEVYAKYSLVAKSGISYDDLYYYYFVQKDIEGDKDKDGNVIAGSKKTKVLKLVNSLNVNKNQKLLLLAASGYSVGDRNTKISLARYITSLKASKDEKAALAELCGFKVKNGVIMLSAIK